MAQWLCNACGYIYDEEQGDLEHGIKPGTKFEDIHENWECPVCGIKKSDKSVWEKL